MKFILPGIPLAKARHRTNGRRTYDPQQKQKEATIWQFQVELTKAIHHIDREIVKETQRMASASAFQVKMSFYFPVNATDSEAVKNAKLWGLIKHNVKPDCSNIIKYYEDTMNNICFKDDCMITFVSGGKFYAEEPYTLIEIEPMETIKISSEAEQVLKLYSPTDMTEILDDIWSFTKFHSCDLEVINESEKQKWFNDIGSEITKFAHKHASKLKKLQSKTEMA